MGLTMGDAHIPLHQIGKGNAERQGPKGGLKILHIKPGQPESQSSANRILVYLWSIL